MSKRKHPSSRRTPQTPHEKDDAFVAGAIDLSQWARTHQQAFTFLGIVLVLLLAGGVYYVRFQRSMTIEAVNRLEIIHETIAFSAFEDAKTQLSTFLDQFGGTDQAREAVILLGRLHLEGGDAAVAINVLERADLGLRDPIGVQAHSLLARAYVDQGRWAEAADARRRVIELGEDVWQQWTWLADLRARAGDPDAALRALQSAQERAGTDEERAQVESFAVQLMDSLSAASR